MVLSFDSCFMVEKLGNWEEKIYPLPSYCGLQDGRSRYFELILMNAFIFSLHWLDLYIFIFCQTLYEHNAFSFRNAFIRDTGDIV